MLYECEEHGFKTDSQAEAFQHELEEHSIDIPFNRKRWAKEFEDLCKLEVD